MILLLLNYELLNVDACSFIITFTCLLNIFNKTFYSHCAALVMNLTSLTNFILYLVSEMPFNILSVELYCSVVCVLVGQCLRFLDVDLYRPTSLARLAVWMSCICALSKLLSRRAMSSAKSRSCIVVATYCTSWECFSEILSLSSLLQE